MTNKKQKNENKRKNRGEFLEIMHKTKGKKMDNVTK